jgi:hypothetical protein
MHWYATSDDALTLFVRALNWLAISANAHAFIVNHTQSSWPKAGKVVFYDAVKTRIVRFALGLPANCCICVLSAIEASSSSQFNAVASRSLQTTRLQHKVGNGG